MNIIKIKIAICLPLKVNYWFRVLDRCLFRQFQNIHLSFFAHVAVAIDVALDWLKVDFLPLSIFLFASFRSLSSWLKLCVSPMSSPHALLESYERFPSLLLQIFLWFFFNFSTFSSTTIYMCKTFHETNNLGFLLVIYRLLKEVLLQKPITCLLIRILEVLDVLNLKGEIKFLLCSSLTIMTIVFFWLDNKMLLWAKVWVHQIHGCQCYWKNGPYLARIMEEPEWEWVFALLDICTLNKVNTAHFFINSTKLKYFKFIS